ncbi:MAG: M28 family peptidase [Gemmatimonadota bacterium]|nr:M28 family peptidase [Gemmatimonadota bacterium]
MLVAGALAACGRGPEPAPETGFAPALAESLVHRQLAFGPRVPGTEAHAAALEWMVGWLEERADVVEPRPFTHVTVAGDTLEMTNVWARFEPERSARILLLAHWDSRPVSEKATTLAARDQPVPGANDGASGVAVLLAVADVLADDPPGVGVDILLTDGEDWGYDPETLETEIDRMLLGARHFAETEGDTYRPLFGILLDMVGDRDPRFPKEGFSVRFAPEVVQRVWNVADELGYGDVFVESVGRSIMDDHVPLNRAGIRTINVIDFEYPWWHTPEDTADKISARTLGMVGDVVLTVIRRAGS